MSQVDPVAGQSPLVTVGVPVYNGARYLEETLRALQNQELRNIEILVADNGSTDATLEIAERVAAEDERFRILYSDVNRGSTWNYNRLLDAARAPLFMWNAADDVILPRHLLKCRQLLVDNPEAVVAFGRSIRVDSSGRYIGDYDDKGLDFLTPGPVGRLNMFFEHGLWYAAFAGLYQTAALRAVGGYDAFYGQDIALAVKMALRAPWVQMQEQSYRQRVHEAQMTNLQGADPVEQTRIFTPGHRRPFAFPAWYLNYRLCVEVIRAPVALGQRLRAIGVVFVHWTLPNWRSLPYDLKRNLVRLIKGRYVGAFDAT
ncbi:glycosyltransferase family 2 protein [Rathayibacter sp. CAU 1779]